MMGLDENVGLPLDLDVEKLQHIIPFVSIENLMCGRMLLRYLRNPPY
jgi:hypothetical protein